MLTASTLPCVRLSDCLGFGQHDEVHAGVPYSVFVALIEHLSQYEKRR